MKEINDLRTMDVAIKEGEIEGVTVEATKEVAVVATEVKEEVEVTVIIIKEKIKKEMTSTLQKIL